MNWLIEHLSGTPGVAEATRPSITIDKIIDNFKSRAYHRDENHLRNPLAGFNGKYLVATVPARNVQLPLVIRVDQTDQVTEHNAVFVAQTRAR
jgi:hypothetical protein